MKKQLLAVLMMLMTLAGCSSAAAPVSSTDISSQAPDSGSQPSSISEEAKPSTDETIWEPLTREEAVDLWRSLGADQEVRFNGRWFYSHPENLFRNAAVIVSLFSFYPDGTMQYTSGYDATDSAWSYTVQKIETDGTAYKIVMADVVKGMTSVRTQFEEDAAPVLMITPGEAGDGQIEMEWIWPECTEEWTGEKSYGELSGSEDVTIYRVPKPEERIEVFDNTERAFYPGAEHTKKAHLDTGIYSPQETTGVQDFVYRQNDW